MENTDITLTADVLFINTDAREVLITLLLTRFTLETTVERGKDVQDIDVHSEDEKSVVTCWVMSLFSVSLGEK